MQQSFKVFTVIGILFTIILGSLSHFFYGWSGNFFLVGFFSPVNESVWEHLKLLFFPGTSLYADRAAPALLPLSGPAV